MKFKKTQKILLTSALICASLFNLSACTNNSESSHIEKNLNLPNRNALSDELLGTPWKNQSISTGLMYRTLFIINADKVDYKPDLVESYEASDDCKEYVLTIKDDVIWSDGETFDIDDIIFSIKGLLLAEQFNGIYQTAFGNIIGASNFMEKQDINEELEGLIKDGNTLTIKLKKPTTNMINILSQFAILPEHCFTNSNIAKIHEDDYWKNPVVTGMYLVDEIVPSEYIKLAYNDAYIGTKPNIDTITLHFNYGFEDGQVLTDLYYTNDVSDVLEYRSNSNMTEHHMDNDFYRYLVFNIDKNGKKDELLNDIRFREAIACAIDREYLINDIYYGLGNIVESNVLYNNFPTYKSNGIAFNPEKSIQLLNDMDFDFDRVIKLLYYYEDDISKNFMQRLKEQLEYVGIKIEIIEPNGISIFEFDDYDICLKGLSTYDISEWYAEYQSTNALHINLIGGTSKFDELIEDFSATHERAEHIRILTELQELEFETLYKYPLFTLKQFMYSNRETLILPNDIEFGNAWYKFDIKFEEWDMKVSE